MRDVDRSNACKVVKSSGIMWSIRIIPKGPVAFAMGTNAVRSPSLVFETNVMASLSMQSKQSAGRRKTVTSPVVIS